MTMLTLNFTLHRGISEALGITVPEQPVHFGTLGKFFSRAFEQVFM